MRDTVAIIAANASRRNPGKTVSMTTVERCDPRLLDAYRTRQRVKVTTTYACGETFTRTGVVAVTTGWAPSLMLLHRSNAQGSWDLLGPGDRVVAVWNGRRYVPMA